MTDDRKDEERRTPSWQLPQERQPDTDAYHIWTPRPLLRSIYWKPDPAPPFEAVSSTYEIFVDQRAWLTMHEHVWQTPPEKTPFGYLIGDLCEDPQANRRFVTITAALPARFDFREDAKEQISREATLALQLEVERRRGVLAGWYHRHLGGDVRMTQADMGTHRQHFSDPWQCAFVFVGGGDRSDGGCFRAMPDRFEGDLLLPFYEMASNESLLARGVKRSYLDWANYQTVDEIRSEPPPRPVIALPASAAAEAEEEPEFVVQPFDAEPDAPIAEQVEESIAAEEEEAEPEPETEPEPEPTGEANLEAAIDSVRSARIELDYQAGPESEGAGRRIERPKEVPKETKPPPEKKRPVPGREPPSGRAADAGPAPREEAATRVSRALSGRRKWIAVAIGGVVLVAALAAGALLLRSGDGAADRPEIDDGRNAATEAVPAEDDGEAGAGAAEVSVTPAQMDSVGSEMLSMISRFYGRAVAYDRGEATCGELAAAYVAVENAWIRYNTDYRARFSGPLPDALAARDERLYAGIQDAEREFEESGCPRP